MDKYNVRLYKDVGQGSDHIRSRPEGSGRHSDAIPTERNGAEGWSGENFLGKEWAKKKGVSHYDDYPSLNEIFHGIMMEARQQVKDTSGCPEGSVLLQEAMDNISATWEELLELVAPKNPPKKSSVLSKMKNLFKKKFDRDSPLTLEILEDPTHRVTQLMLVIYSYECFLYKTLNHSTRFGDLSKVDSLGPYAHVMHRIVDFAIMARKDELDEKKFRDLDLYRGTCLNDKQIKQYQDYVGKKIETDEYPGEQYGAKIGDPDTLAMYGFISTSTSCESAVSFANPDPSQDKQAVLYHIKWTKGLVACWYLDDSAYPDEKEVLIMDGMTFQVLSVKKETVLDKELILIKLKSTD
jgi:hypothetical protein